MKESSLDNSGFAFARLGPKENFRVIPFMCDWAELTVVEKARESAGRPGQGPKASRYSIWCDQFTVENQDLPTSEDGEFAYAAQLLRFTPSLVCDPAPRTGNYQLAVSQAQKRGNPPPDPEPYCRYALTFTEFKPQENSYLADHRSECRKGQ